MYVGMPGFTGDSWGGTLADSSVQADYDLHDGCDCGDLPSEGSTVVEGFLSTRIWSRS